MTQGLGDIRVGVVGTGFMGPVHVEALRRVGVRVQGIVGTSEEGSLAAAKALQIKNAYVSFEQMLADPVIDSVHLCVPNHLHFSMTKEALAAGKHVMCEKPLGVNSKETAELMQIAKKSVGVAAVNYNLRFYPLCQEAAARVQSGAVGAPLYVSGGYCQDWLLHNTDFNWRVLKNEGGPLRAVADIGTHWLDMIQMITGQKVVAVCSDLMTVYPERFKPVVGASQTFTKGQKSDQNYKAVAVDTEDMGCLLLRLADGTRGNVLISQVSAGRKNRFYFEVGGTSGSLAWDGERPNEMWLGFRDRPNELLIKDPTLMSSQASAYCAYPSGHAEGYPDTFKQCFKAFYEYIAAGDRSAKPTFPTFEDGHQEALLCEAILTSHEQQKWVDVRLV